MYRECRKNLHFDKVFVLPERSGALLAALGSSLDALDTVSFPWGMAARSIVQSGVLEELDAPGSWVSAIAR